MEVTLRNRTVNRPFAGTLAIAAGAAIIALAVAVAPSFAGSYLTKREAMKTFVKKADVPPQPTARIVPNNADVGPFSSTTPVDIAGARAVFKTTTETSDVVITFSGEATCSGNTAGVGCPIQVLVDGYPNPKVNFLTASNASPAPKEDLHTFVTSAVVTPGQHVVSVRWAGATDTSLNFKLFDYNLVVQSYPTGDVVEPEPEA